MCAWCSAVTPTSKTSPYRYCGPNCRTAAAALRRHMGKSSPLTPCEDCGLPCRPRAQARDQSLCNRCRFVKKGRQRNIAMARRRHAENAGDKITWQKLGDRDGWRCHICDGIVKQVAGAAKQPHGATIDHLVPVADDGRHTWDNVALAHRSCNVRRGAGGAVQLRLAG